MGLVTASKDMSLLPSTEVQRNPRVVHRSLVNDSGAVLLHLDTGAYHGLDQIGELIWGLIEEPISYARLVDELRDRVEDPPAELASDVAAFLRQLKERDLVILGADQDGGSTLGN